MGTIHWRFFALINYNFVKFNVFLRYQCATPLSSFQKNKRFFIKQRATLLDAQSTGQGRLQCWKWGNYSDSNYWKRLGNGKYFIFNHWRLAGCTPSLNFYQFLFYVKKKELIQLVQLRNHIFAIIRYKISLFYPGKKREKKTHIPCVYQLVMYVLLIQISPGSIERKKQTARWEWVWHDFVTGFCD